MTNTISDKTKVPLFVVIGSAAVLIPTIVSVTMWITTLRTDATLSLNQNTDQDKQIEQINQKLNVVYEMNTDLKTIMTVMKIKKSVMFNREENHVTEKTN